MITLLDSVQLPAQASRLRQPAWRRLAEWAMCALPVTAAIGQFPFAFQFAGGVYYPFKLIIPALFLIMLAIPIIRVRRTTITLSYLVLTVLWLAWGIASLAWSADPQSGIQEVTILLFACMMAWVMVWLATIQPSTISALRRGWVIAYLVTGAVAIWEMTTGQRLITEFVTDQPASIDQVALSTFGNPNNYAAFVALCFPFLVWSLLSARRWQPRLLYALLTASAPMFLSLGASRFAFIAVVFQIVVLIFFRAHNLKSAALIITLVAVASLGVLVVGETSGRLFYKFTVFFAEGGESLTVIVRSALAVNGLWFLVQSFGLGIGAGSYEAFIRDGRIIVDVPQSVVNPHNLWVEVLSQYGIVIFIGFAYCLIQCASIALRARRLAMQGRVRRYHLKDVRIASEIVFMALVGYIFAACTASSYFSDPVNWVFISSIAVIASALEVWLRRSRPISRTAAELGARVSDETPAC